MKIMILGASYGSLLATKLLMAGHDVTLICRPEAAKLINTEGTIVRIKLRDEDNHRAFRSTDFDGQLAAAIPDDAAPEEYDMIAFAMQEPQYSAAEISRLLKRVAQSDKPCISIMNMPPPPYLKRISGLKDMDLTPCFDNIGVWGDFNPENVTLCSPDPQAFIPEEEKSNVLHVGLPTNFKAANFSNAAHSALLGQIEADIANVRIDGKDVPVKLRVHNSLFVPMAKWSMLLTGNYRCVLADGVQSIRDSVHNDINESRDIYEWVGALAEKIGASPDDMVPFDKYAQAALDLLKPSSAARAIDGGSGKIERVDHLVWMIGKNLGLENEAVNAIVKTVDMRLEQNRASTN